MALRPHVADVVSPLFRLLDSWSDQPPLFSTCLSIAARATRAAAGDGDSTTSIYLMVLHMVSVSTDPQGQHYVFLLEAGLELWYCLIMQCNPMFQQSEELQGLYSRMPTILEGNMEHCRICMLITEAYVVLGGGEFLAVHGANVSSCMDLMVGEVKEQVMCYVARAMEAVLRKFPSQGSTLLFSTITKAAYACVSRMQRAGHRDLGAQGNKEELEPDIIITQYASLVCRVILGGDMDAWNRLHSSTGISVSEFVNLLTELFDIAGDLLHRKLWTWTMIWALRIDPKSALSQLGEICGCCIQVLGEISNQSQTTSTLLSDDVSDNEGEWQVGQSILNFQQCSSMLLTMSLYTSSQCLPEPPLAVRIREDMNADYIATTNLKDIIREGMDACLVSVGPDVFQAALGAVEPMVVQQLFDMVRSV